MFYIVIVKITAKENDIKDIFADVSATSATIISAFAYRTAVILLQVLIVRQE